MHVVLVICFDLLLYALYYGGLDGSPDTDIYDTYNKNAGMKEIKLNGHDVRIYDSIDALPIVRFHQYNRMLLVDAGIGSDITDFDGHVERVVRYIRKGDNENAAKELDNLRQNVFMIMSGQSVHDLSFACLVHSIDGEAVEDISPEGLEKVLHVLGGATRKELAENFQSVKKKIDDELGLYFPSLFDDVSTREYYDILKRMTVATLAMIADGSEEKGRQADELRERLVLFQKPKVFTGHDGVEVVHDKEFETMCLVITKETGRDAKKMTVLEYYNAYEYLREKARKTANKAR